MFPHFSQLLEHSPSAMYMVVRSGTSRLVVLNGSEIRSGRQAHEEVLSIMLGFDGHGGLGGPTLQDNKVVLVWPEAKPAQFRFRFLQVVPSTNAVLPMECSNSASASAMLAQLGGHHVGQESRWRAVNLSTGQKLELRPDASDRIARSWAVRFVTSPAARKALRGLSGYHCLRFRGMSIKFCPVLLGNLFLFAEVDPTEIDVDASEAIAQAGMRVARNAGCALRRGYHPKVIPYRILSDEIQPEVHTASYYIGERHRSFPGSAAMALSAFLALQWASGTTIPTHWQIKHPSGLIDVELGFSFSNRGPKLLWTEFVTPVSLLSWGAVALPWRRRT